jgi:hypothetical protein
MATKHQPEVKLNDTHRQYTSARVINITYAFGEVRVLEKRGTDNTMSHDVTYFNEMFLPLNFRIVQSIIIL